MPLPSNQREYNGQIGFYCLCLKVVNKHIVGDCYLFSLVKLGIRQTIYLGEFLRKSLKMCFMFLISHKLLDTTSIKIST